MPDTYVLLAHVGEADNLLNIEVGFDQAPNAFFCVV